MPYALLYAQAITLFVGTILLGRAAKPTNWYLAVTSALRLNGVLFVAICPAFFAMDAGQAAFGCLWIGLISGVLGYILYEREALYARLAELSLGADSARTALRLAPPPPVEPAPPTGPLPDNVLPFRRRDKAST